MDLEGINGILDQISEMSDDQLSTVLCDVLKGFRKNRPGETLEETKRFISELRDYAVHGGAASGFVMTCFSIVVGDGRTYPPPEEGKFKEWVDYWTKAPLVQIAESLDKTDG